MICLMKLKLRMSWLKKHDNDWFEKNLPEKKYSKTTLQEKQIKIQKEWNEKDMKYLKILSEYKQSGKYIKILSRSRITKSYLDRRVLNYPLSRYLSKVPKSKEIYEELLESSEVYYEKKIEYYLNTVENYIATEGEIVEAIGISQGSKYHDSIKGILREKMDKYRENIMKRKQLIE